MKNTKSLVLLSLLIASVGYATIVRVVSGFDGNTLTISAADGAIGIALQNRSKINVGVTAGGLPVYLQATGGGNLFLVGNSTAGAGGFMSDAPSGSVAFQAQNAGAKITLSNGGTDTLTGNGSTITFGGKAGITSNSGTCTLNGGTPSACTVTVTAGAVCQCAPVGTTAVIAAAGCAVSLSSTTLTVTSGATLTNVVNVLCDR